jgi:hypothetical protein
MASFLLALGFVSQRLKGVVGQVKGGMKAHRAGVGGRSDEASRGVVPGNERAIGQREQSVSRKPG